MGHPLSCKSQQAFYNLVGGKFLADMDPDYDWEPDADANIKENVSPHVKKATRTLSRTDKDINNWI